MLVKKAWQQGYEEFAFMFTTVRKREEMLEYSVLFLLFVQSWRGDRDEDFNLTAISTICRGQCLDKLSLKLEKPSFLKLI